MRTSRYTRTAGRLSLLIASSTLAALTVRAQEPGVPCAEGDVVGLCYGEHATCTIGFAGDIDIFFFQGKAGDEVRLVMSGASNGLDPRLDVRDPTNTSIAANFCTNGGSTCTFVLSFVLPLTGGYTIIADESGNTETGTYVIDLERVMPLTPEPFILPDFATGVNIGFRGDHDYLRFDAEAGSEVRFVINGLTNGLDPMCDVFADDGTLLFSKHCSNGGSTCSFQINAGGANPDFVFPGQVGSFGQLGEVRRYFLRLSDNGLTESGSINVTMNCLFSPSLTCPAPQPSFGPVGMSYCTSTLNSKGTAASITGMGSSTLVDDDFHLTASGLPAEKSAIFLYSLGQTTIPIGQGALCVQPPIGRFPLQTICGLGNAHLPFDLPNLTQSFTIQPGSTWNFQLWFRDDDGLGGSTTNTTDGLNVSFQ